MSFNEAVKGGAPQIGIFYYINGELFSDRTFIHDIQDSGRYKDILRIHPDYWVNTVCQFRSEFHNLDAYYFPRGRVLYDTQTDTYQVLLDQCLKRDHIMDQITKDFNLPRDMVTWKLDYEHYSCHKCRKK